MKTLKRINYVFKKNYNILVGDPVSETSLWNWSSLNSREFAHPLRTTRFFLDGVYFIFPFSKLALFFSNDKSRNNARPGYRKTCRSFRLATFLPLKNIALWGGFRCRFSAVRSTNKSPPCLQIQYTGCLAVCRP